MSDKSFIRPIRVPGRRYVLTKSMIEEAQKHTKSNMEAARWLKVSYNTYKKWAKYYNLFDQHLNQSGKGIKKVHVNYKASLDDIFNNRYPDYPCRVLKKRLISEGLIKEECSVCGYDEERLTDNKVCLHLDYIDGNKENKVYDNLRLLCPNCYFTNVSEFLNSKKFCQ